MKMKILHNLTFLKQSTIQNDNSHNSSNTKYRKRMKGNIIRSVHFNPDADSENYYRELIMLYFPRRNEENLADCNTFCDRFKQIPKDIEAYRLIYEPYAFEVHTAQQILSTVPDLQDAWDELTPGTEDQDSRDHELRNQPPKTGIEDYNIAWYLGVPSSPSDSDLHDFNELTFEYPFFSF